MHYFKTLSILATTTAALAMPVQAQAQEMMISQIFEMGSNFCPRGSVALDGQLLAINQNQALFSLLGTTYGGDGRTSFGIPDMRGRSPVHEGRGPGLSSVRLGQKGGMERSSLTAGGSGTQVDSRLFSGQNKVNTNVETRDPYLVVTYCMVTQGIFPSRS